MLTRGNGPVCVIGAGPSGLAVCKALKQAAIPFVCFEAGRSVGGIWDVEGGHGGGYRSLHTNTSKAKMAFSDFPFPEEVPLFPSHVDMLAYFNAYVDRFELRDHIRLNSRVVSAEPTSNGRWTIRTHDETEAGDEATFSACIVSTGQYETMRWPKPMPPGDFAGDVMHASDYLDPQTPIDCRGKRVLVVGLGASAAEIATELAGGKDGGAIAAQTLISARSGRYVMPKYVAGVPLDSNAAHASDELPEAARVLPPDERLKMARTLIGAALGSVQRDVGQPSDWGLPNPEFPPWGERPTLSDGFIPALTEGRVQTRGAIEGFDGSDVKFVDGSNDEVDVVVYATGYELRFPFLGDEVLGREARDLALYRRVVHPSQPNLYFVGFTRVLCSLWTLSEQQAIWLAQVLKGSFDLPEAAVQTKEAIQVSKETPVFCNLTVHELRDDARQRT